MKVSEHLANAKDYLISYEVIPPPRGRSAQPIIDIVEKLQPYNPPFIDVTSHSAEAYYDELADGTVQRRIRRKRPGTISLCGIIQNRFKIDTVAHVLCRGFTKEETEDALIELNYLGIHNVLAIRGDETNYQKPMANNRTANVYAEDLVRQIGQLKEGHYLEPVNNAAKLDFCVGVGAYPEKHFEAPNLKTDINYLKKKIDAGAEYVVSQMFYDTDKYFHFLKACEKEDINVPIVPGLKLLTRVKQLTTIPKNFYVDLPDELVDEVLENPTHVEEIGFNWAFKQCEQLLNGGVKYLHFYIMNDADGVLKLVDKLNKI